MPMRVPGALTQRRGKKGRDAEEQRQANASAQIVLAQFQA